VEKIKVGVVGAGYFGQFHLEKYLKMEEVKLVGVADIDPSRCKEMVKRYSIQTFSHHSDLFGKVQSVSIAVPTPFHHPIARDFFLQGVDVLIEKPIAGTLEEADELIALAESNGLILQVGHLERFNGAFQAVRERVQNPFFIESQRLSPFTGRGADVDVVLDLMVHDIDIILSLVHSSVTNLEATGLSILTPYFDVANARIEFENGCKARLTASRASEERIRKTTIYQPDGVLTIDYHSQGASFSKKGTELQKDPLTQPVTEEIPVRKVDLLEEEIRSFLESVRDRKEARVSGRDGRRVLDIDHPQDGRRIKKTLDSHHSGA
jgi:predicted dehydrogenase